MNQSSLSNPKYEQLADNSVVEKLVENLKTRNIESSIVTTSAEALEKIKTLIPQGGEVMNGSSTTLHQIGFVDYLKAGQHGWNNVHEAILNEKDPTKQALLRKQSVLADYFLGSVHAVTESGELLIASNSSSQLPSYAFTSKNVIWVVGTHKIVPTLDDAMTRVREYVLPLEDNRMKEAGMHGSAISKMLIIEKEPPFLGRKLHVIFVNERLGF